MKNLKFAIDARTISGLTGGTKNYTYSLLTSMLEIDSENQFYTYLNRDVELNFKNCSKVHSSIKPQNHPANEVWTNTLLPFELLKNKIDIFHSPAIEIPIVPMQTKSILTIHDMIPFIFPELFPKKFSTFYKLTVTLSAKRADKIIAVSEHTKKDIVNILNIKHEKIDVIYNGLSTSINKVPKNNNERRPYILHLGTIEPRKNILLLTKVFEYLKDKHKIPHELVLVGNKGWLSDETFDYINRSKYLSDIKILQSVDDNKLSHIMSNADIFAFLSQYEGFGLPILEAMKCGVPVITANNSSIPEVANNAALLVDIHNFEDAANAFMKLIESEELKKELINKGFENIKKFSWAKAAQETLETYKNC